MLAASMFQQEPYGLEQTQWRDALLLPNVSRITSEPDRTMKLPLQSDVDSRHTAKYCVWLGNNF